MRDHLTNKMFGATLLAGAVSGITFMMIPGALWVGPGLLFGVATAWVLKNKMNLTVVQCLFWAAASTGAWYLAIQNYVAHVGTPGSAGYQTFVIANNSALTNMILAGLIGSAVLAFGFSLLARKISLIGVLVSVVCGVALAVVMYFILNTGKGTQLGGTSSVLSYAKLAAAFAIWQVGVGLSLLAYKSSALSKTGNPSLLGYIWIVPIALLCLGVPYLERQQHDAAELKQAQNIRDNTAKQKASQLQSERDLGARLPEVYIFTYDPAGGPIRPGFRYSEGNGKGTGNRDAVWAQQDTVAGIQKSIWTEQGDAAVLPDAYKCNFLQPCTPIAKDASGDTIYMSYSPNSPRRIYGLIKGKSIIRIGSPHELSTSDVIAVANSLRLATPAEREQVWF